MIAVVARQPWRWAIGVLGLLLLIACGRNVTSSVTPNIAIIEPAFGSQLERGESLYAANCANCHGPAGEGLGPFPALNSAQHAYAHPDWELVAIIHDGQGAMPAFGERLSADEITDIIARLKAWWGPGQLSEQRQICLLKPPPTPMPE